MRLLYHPLSSYSRKTAIGIGLRGDPVELVTLDVFSGALKRPEFTALNPFGKMPVLETDQGPVYESTSILEHLEARGPAVLIPADQAAKARHFDRLADLYLMEPIGAFFWDKAPAVREAAVGTTAKAWALFEAELADGRPFVCGEHITLADLSAAVAGSYAVTEGLPLAPAIEAYLARLESHPVLAASRAAALPFVQATLPRRTPAAPAP